MKTCASWFAVCQLALVWAAQDEKNSVLDKKSQKPEGAEASAISYRWLWKEPGLSQKYYLST